MPHHSCLGICWRFYGRLRNHAFFTGNGTLSFGLAPLPKKIGYLINHFFPRQSRMASSKWDQRSARRPTKLRPCNIVQYKMKTEGKRLLPIRLFEIRKSLFCTIYTPIYTFPEIQMCPLLLSSIDVIGLTHKLSYWRNTISWVTSYPLTNNRSHQHDDDGGKERAHCISGKVYARS
jgi:hypothetical protein